MHSDEEPVAAIELVCLCGERFGVDDGVFALSFQFVDPGVDYSFIDVVEDLVEDFVGGHEDFLDLVRMVPTVSPAECMES